MNRLISQYTEQCLHLPLSCHATTYSHAYLWRVGGDVWSSRKLISADNYCGAGECVAKSVRCGSHASQDRYNRIEE
jgi:hypothetical protein